MPSAVDRFWFSFILLPLIWNASFSLGSSSLCYLLIAFLNFFYIDEYLSFFLSFCSFFFLFSSLIWEDGGGKSTNMFVFVSPHPLLVFVHYYFSSSSFYLRQYCIYTFLPFQSISDIFCYFYYRYDFYLGQCKPFFTSKARQNGKATAFF